MKIWIDFINTPQVSFFIPFIKEFRNKNYDILLTCRDSGNTVDLLIQHDLEFMVIGERAGKGIIQKLLFFPRRLFSLYFFIRKNKPDVAASQSSFYQPIVARMLRIPCFYTNDNEHAKGNLFGFLFATKVALPVALKDEDFANKKRLKSKLVFYPSVKEAIYLSQAPDLRQLASGKKNTVYFRPEPSSAQYYKGPENFFDKTLLRLSGDYRVVILPRDKNQADHYSLETFSGITVARKPISLQDIIADCLLFIGAGGSMTRELAVLEVPVISIYQAEILCVDRYLIDKGLMLLKPDITYDEIKRIIDDGSVRSSKDFNALKEGEGSYSLIRDLIINLENE
jgi:uncharacterized protein